MYRLPGLHSYRLVELMVLASGRSTFSTLNHPCTENIVGLNVFTAAITGQDVSPAFVRIFITGFFLTLFNVGFLRIIEGIFIAEYASFAFKTAILLLSPIFRSLISSLSWPLFLQAFYPFVFLLQHITQGDDGLIYYGSSKTASEVKGCYEAWMPIKARLLPDRSSRA